MRSEFIRFLRLAYLLDFVVVQSLGMLYVSNVKLFLDSFAEKNSLKAANPLVGMLSNTEGNNQIYKQPGDPFFSVEMTLK